MDKYLSIITNFGCHYTCPYCIVKNNNLNIPKTTCAGLRKLPEVYTKGGYNVVSISGGGDPLFNWQEYKNRCWWHTLRTISYRHKMQLELHTSIIDSGFDLMHMFMRIVYHLRSKEQLKSIKRSDKEIVRVVYVVTDDMTEQDIFEIADFAKNSDQIDELSFRQRVDAGFVNSYHLHEFLQSGHQKDWWYITQCDYNDYYVENEVFHKYSEIGNVRSDNY